LTGQCKFDGIYFVFFSHPQKERGNPTHIAHIGKPHKLTLKPKLAKECNFAYALGANNKSNTFYIEKRDKYSILANSIQKSMNRIKEVLEEKGIKQKWLADKLGKSYNMVNGYVQNRQQPRLEILFEIAKILEVDPKELIQSTND
jgi:putative transcriptional regulator